MIYQSSKSRSGPPSLGLNPMIRGLRLVFIILFTILDVGQVVYKVRPRTEYIIVTSMYK